MTKLISYLLIIAGLLVTSKAHGATIITSEHAQFNQVTDKVAHVTGDIDDTSNMLFQLEMAITTFMPGDRVILINSNGGKSTSGDRMIESIELEKAEGTKVICVVQYAAHSMAFNLLTHCSVRLSVPHARFLVHKLAFGAWPSEDERMTAKTLRRFARELDKDDEPYRQANAKAMGLSLKDYDLFAEQDTYWRAEKLIGMHYLDGFASYIEN